jgi:hypothetical protein
LVIGKEAEDDILKKLEARSWKFEARSSKLEARSSKLEVRLALNYLMNEK